MTFKVNTGKDRETKYEILPRLTDTKAAFLPPCWRWYCLRHRQSYPSDRLQSSVMVNEAKGHRHRNLAGEGGGAGPLPPIFTLEPLLISIHAAQIAAIAVYITFSPPKKEMLPMAMRRLGKKARVFIMTFELLSMDRHFTKDTELAKSL